MAAQLRFVRKTRHPGRVFENGSISLAWGGASSVPLATFASPSKGGIPLSRHCAESTENGVLCRGLMEPRKIITTCIRGEGDRGHSSEQYQIIFRISGPMRNFANWLHFLGYRLIGIVEFWLIDSFEFW